MSFLTLTIKNTDTLDKELNYEVLPSLLNGISSKKMMVQKYVIENASSPIFYFRENVYLIKMIYSTYEVDTYLTMTGNERAIAGDKNRIFEVDHLVEIINDGFTTATAALDVAYFAGTSSHLPSTTAPRIIYDNSTELFSFIAPTTAYNNSINPHIRIILNNELFYILKGIPITEYSVSGNYEGLFELLFNPTAENVYLTSYTIITQEFNTFNTWCDMDNIIMTSNLPVEAETILVSSKSSNTESLNILQDYKPVFDSVKTFRTPLVYNAPTMDYRKVKCIMDKNNNIRISVFYYSKYRQQYIKFMTPPNSTSIVKLLFSEN